MEPHIMKPPSISFTAFSPSSRPFHPMVLNGMASLPIPGIRILLPHVKLLDHFYHLSFWHSIILVTSSQHPLLLRFSLTSSLAHVSNLFPLYTTSFHPSITPTMPFSTHPLTCPSISPDVQHCFNCMLLGCVFISQCAEKGEIFAVAQGESLSAAEAMGSDTISLCVTFPF